MPPGAAFVIAIILLSAAGFVLVLLYKVLLWRAARRADREEWMPTRRARRPLPTRSVMSRARYAQAPTQRAITEQRSYAVERPTEQPGTGGMEPVPALWEQVGTLSDDALLRELALVMAPDGTPKYAESRIAKFIGGRVEDRIAQVRAVRGVVVEPRPIRNASYPRRTSEQDVLRKELGIGKS